MIYTKPNWAHLPHIKFYYYLIQNLTNLSQKWLLHRKKVFFKIINREFNCLPLHLLFKYSF